MKKIVVGVTGGLASGKTAVTDMFIEKGAMRIDADEIGHELLENNKHLIDMVVAQFGKDVVTEGRIDRRKLAGKVFGDKHELENLCRILHPPIIDNIKERIRSAGSEVVVIDAPLLIEVGLQKIVDKVVVVTLDPATQVERAVSRGIPEKEAKNIMRSQMPLSEKLKSADYVIDNTGDMQKTKEGVEEIWQDLQKKKKN